MTGPELRQLREDLGEAIGRPLSVADMAKLSGLAPDVGPDTIRRWRGRPGRPVAELLGILAMASDRYPILENFDIFDRFNIPENQRQARREEVAKKCGTKFAPGLSEADRAFGSEPEEACAALANARCATPPGVAAHHAAGSSFAIAVGTGLAAPVDDQSIIFPAQQLVKSHVPGWGKPSLGCGAVAFR